MPGPVAFYMSDSAIQAHITPDKIGYILMLSPRRVGCRAFMTFLEYRYFTPDMPANDQYELFQIKWEKMLYFLVLIPQAKKHLAEELLKELGLRAADGIPHVIDASGVAKFPVGAPNVFTVETIAGHFAYKNDQALNKTAEQLENEACNKVINDYMAAYQSRRRGI